MSGRIVRSLVAATAATLVLSGCTGGEADGEAEASPVPIRTMTQDELVDVLPALEEVRGGSEVDRTCPVDGEPACVRPAVAEVDALTASRDYTLEPVGGPADVERAENGSGIGERVFVRVEQWADADAARERIEVLREDEAQFDGDFDLPLLDTEQGYTPGRKGNGAIEQLEVAGRPAQVMDYEATFTFRDVDPEERLEVQVSVLADDVVLQVLLVADAASRERAQVRGLALDLAAAMVGRLPEESSR